MSDINVQDETKADEVLRKTKRWFNGNHTFDTVKLDTNLDNETPTTLGISVGDGSTTGEKIG